MRLSLLQFQEVPQTSEIYHLAVWMKFDDAPARLLCRRFAPTVPDPSSQYYLANTLSELQAMSQEQIESLPDWVQGKSLSLRIVEYPWIAVPEDVERYVRRVFWGEKTELLHLSPHFSVENTPPMVGTHLFSWSDLTTEPIPVLVCAFLAPGLFWPVRQLPTRAPIDLTPLINNARPLHCTEEGTLEQLPGRWIIREIPTLANLRVLMNDPYASCSWSTFLKAWIVTDKLGNILVESRLSEQDAIHHAWQQQSSILEKR